MSEAEALANDLDMIPALRIEKENTKFIHDKLIARTSQIERLISRHLGIPANDFALYPPSAWIEGGFNICLPIDIKNSHNVRLPSGAVIRFPLPYNAGESFIPGTLDEKLCCEAATYFTAVENESLHRRFVWQIRRLWNPHSRSDLTDTGYLLLEWVEDGKMLSSSWHEKMEDPERRRNLYHGLAKILLRLANVPLARIGSWTMDNDGDISLTNRPIFDLQISWNRHAIPTEVSRNTTYTSAASYVHDKLRFQEQRLIHQPNSILSVNDGTHQLAALVGMRALLPRFFTTQSDSGPFVLSLPDLHRSNIFVDDDWNVTGVIDLEFAPVVPQEMVTAPAWLTGRGVDELEGESLEQFRKRYDEFVRVLEIEEKAVSQNDSSSQRLRRDLDTGMFWYVLALSTINAYPGIFAQHLMPRFFPQEFQLHIEGASLSRLWGEDVDDFITRKLDDNENYKVAIRDIFDKASRYTVEG
ncbi:hypothetical protein M436DRAFT_73985 [Aureobasidium namibiae CBS 147.97]|uniref:Aminoglycoside phosphotransferase domain-containing protein n=1 Tax=Aureobasidium namibiae CBS 147.97 TaxID=1043004 RepID=A0A074WRF1_9PEZI|nr:uncharacterized protein M436DRAFT_73985 [Aureobasidium namibiae CBS 147.97]KEQ72282.1 hypothetical protein M436DRAFT_73985 [Aureobasidium namibiae CBS 147.97]